MSGSEKQPASPDTETLRSAISQLSQFVSESILDPHWGFLATFSGAGQYAQTPEELQRILGRVLDTLDLIELSDQRLAALEQRLRDHDLPDIARLRACSARAGRE